MVGSIYCSCSGSVDVLVAVCDSVTEIKTFQSFTLHVPLFLCVWLGEEKPLGAGINERYIHFVFTHTNKSLKNFIGNLNRKTPAKGEKKQSKLQSDQSKNEHKCFLFFRMTSCEELHQFCFSFYTEPLFLTSDGF